MRPGPKPGQRPSGRQRGAPNKDKLETRMLIEAACPGWDPLQAMAKAAQTGSFEVWDHETDAPKRDPETGAKVTVPISDKTRGAMLKEVCEYCFPKRKAIEVSDPNGDPITLGLAIEFVGQ